MKYGQCEVKNEVTLRAMEQEGIARTTASAAITKWYNFKMPSRRPDKCYAAFFSALCDSHLVQARFVDQTTFSALGGDRMLLEQRASDESPMVSPDTDGYVTVAEIAQEEDSMIGLATLCEEHIPARLFRNQSRQSRRDFSDINAFLHDDEFAASSDDE